MIAAGAVTLASSACALPVRLTLRPADPAYAYLEARTAAMNGDYARSAQLFANLSAQVPGETGIAKRALATAIEAGRFDLALSLARRVPAAELSSDVRLLIVADEIGHKRYDNALAWLAPNRDGGDPSFLKPIITAWAAADRNDLNGALQVLSQIPGNSPLASAKNEMSAYILLKAGKAAQAEPFARRAIGSAGARESQIRLVLASGFLKAGDRALAVAMLDGIDPESTAAGSRLLAGKLGDIAIDTPGEAFSQIMTSIAGDLARLQRTVPPLGLAQVARFADPANSGATILTAVLLDMRKRDSAALDLLAAVPSSDPLISQVRDTQVKILAGQKRFAEALAIAIPASRQRDATLADWSRLGDIYAASDRNAEAAAAYGQAVALGRSGRNDVLWTLYLLQGSALQQAGRWPEAKDVLNRALAIAPEQPLLLNFVGYAKLERGEDLDSAEAMIRKASELAPDDASITDSLGWALFKRGKVGEAIQALATAAEKDPEQAEIQEHLGDALFASGRRYEARFAWRAGLVTAEDDVAARLKAKLEKGLAPDNAAP